MSRVATAMGVLGWCGYNAIYHITRLRVVSGIIAMIAYILVVVLLAGMR